MGDESKQDLQVQRRRRDAKLAHRAGERSEAGTVGRLANNAEPRQGRHGSTPNYCYLRILEEAF